MKSSVSNAIAPGNAVAPVHSEAKATGPSSAAGRRHAPSRHQKRARSTLLALAATLLFLLPAGAIERSDRILRIHGAYYPAEDFHRISEFFTGRENFGGRIVRRSFPEYREGYYLSVRLRAYPYRKKFENAVRLDIVRPGELDPETYWFALDASPRRTPEILLGLTGDDWPDPAAEPLAWRLAFYDPDGREIAWAKSYLWGENAPPDEKP